MSLDNDKHVKLSLHEHPGPEAASRYMAIAGTFVRCAKCSRDFRSTLTFKTLHDFERAATVGFIAQCPNCYTIFDCNRSNMYCEMAPRDHDATGEVLPMPSRRPAD